MSNTESWKTWVPLIILLVAFGLFAALWPTISTSFGDIGFGGGSSTRIPYEPQPIVINVPPSIDITGFALGGPITIPDVSIPVPLPTFEIPGFIEAGSEMIVFATPLAAIIFLTGAIFVPVLLAGALFGLIYVGLSKLTVKTEASESYQEHKTALDAKEKERLKIARESRPADPIPDDPEMPRWSVISTRLIILMFVWFFGMAIVTTFFPEQLMELGGELINPTSLIVGIPLLITAAVLVFAPRWGTAFLAILVMYFINLATLAVFNILDTVFNTGLLEALTLSQLISLMGVEQILTLVILAYVWKPAEPVLLEKAAEAKSEKVKDVAEDDADRGIPYDGIVILATGLLVVGLGLGAMLLVNSPYYELIEQLLAR